MGRMRPSLPQWDFPNAPVRIWEKQMGEKMENEGLYQRTGLPLWLRED